MKITLKAARVNAGLKLIEAAEQFGINKDTLSKYERDSSNVPRSFFINIEAIYKIPVENIFFGPQSDFFRKLKTA
ncbi:helix-turn-helix transcriptional regulator [Bacillus sp. FJAT-49705]|uniref:Helix-turn-helix transcriptional regulator n=1 Tax=Cytobacillus citreus TaxID=2833586 RepID=A0ABS5NWL9_9BACI|nr:helix-turn-helix transcriptional regulator [Cytobacillus citreus]MBS4191783.1 helix-turn-helix transcriptional regulator [Cytobacillus citreus]